MYLAGMEPDADVGGEPARSAMLGKCALDGDGTSNCGVGIVERHEEPVASMVNLGAFMTQELAAQAGIVPAAKVTPGFVTNHADQLGRPSDVGDHEGATHPNR